MTKTQTFLLTTMAIAGLALAGCVDADLADLDAADKLKDRPQWNLGLQDCEEGGFAAIYPMGEGSKLADTWVLADVREEFNNPIRDGRGTPLSQQATANIHFGIRCETAEYNGETLQDFHMGWVGRMVEAPDWDVGGADLHFYLAGFGIQESPVLDGLWDTTMADITTAVEARVTWAGPVAGQGFVDTIYDDYHKGQYVSRSLVEQWREFDDRTVRFWWQVPADGGRSELGRYDHHAGEEMDHSHDDGQPIGWNPVFWDMHTTGGTQWTTTKNAPVEVACHFQEGAHGPQGGACQPTLTNIYHHGALHFEYGWVIEDVWIEDAWTH